MKQQSFKSKVINAFLSGLINGLYQWAAQWDGAYFFIVVGDEQCHDVAYFNHEALESVGGMSIASNPKIAAMFDRMRVPYDLFLEDYVKDEDYKKSLEFGEVPNAGWNSDEWPEEQTTDAPSSES